MMIKKINYRKKHVDNCSKLSHFIYNVFYKKIKVMNIQNISSINYQNNYNNLQSFKGYGARPLETIVIRNPKYFPSLYRITNELMNLSKKYSFRVLSEGKKIVDSITDVLSYGNNLNYLTPWIQDTVMAFNGILFYKGTNDNKSELPEYLGMEYRKTNPSMYIPGGNIFLLDNDVILLGENEDSFDAKASFNPKKLIRVPQADFHLDLFIRPLKDNVVLAVDDNMTLDMLQKMLDKLSKDKKSNSKIISNVVKLIKDMKYAKRYTHYASTEKVISKLEEEGFKVVRVPGRITKLDVNNSDNIVNILNYMNAIVHEEPNGDLVYITNRSLIMHRLGISARQARALNINIEQIFADSIKDYIKSENIHFINGKTRNYDGEEQSSRENMQYILEKEQGGIHCLCMEIPKEF